MLALDIPPAPDVVLEAVHATEVKIAWKQPDAQTPPSKHAIYFHDSKGDTYALATERSKLIDPQWASLKDWKLA